MSRINGQAAKRPSMGEMNNDVHAHAGPSRKRSLYAPPTIAEMDRLRTANETGNTFTLQVEALLRSTLLPPSSRAKSLLSDIHNLILSLPSLPPISPRDARGVPFPGGDEWSPRDVKWMLGWEKPVEVFVGGSWPVCGGYKKGKDVMGEIDLVVVMPESLFSPKDRLNYRYFHKRAYYLAVIKAAIDKSMNVEWESGRRPVLRIGGTHAIRIHAAAPDIFTLSPAKFQIQGEPTPLYTSDLIHDTLHKAHLLHMHQLSQQIGTGEVASFLALWRIWASRRAIPRNRGGSGWFASMLLGWVVNGGTRGKGLGKLGYWNALRAAWEFVANFTSPVYLGTSTPRADFTGNVFVDPSGRVNIFAEWELGEIQLLQHFARETLAMLEDGVDRFAEVFSTDYTPASVFDDYIHVDTASCHVQSTLTQRAELPLRTDLLARTAADVLRRGLSDRARLVHVVGDLHIGIIYNANATRVMDIGPAPDSPDCAAFQALWGEQSELRRFKDGSITESVVWDIARPEDATLIPGRIVDWLLRRHFHAETTNIEHFSASQDWLGMTQTPLSARNAVAVAGSEKLGFSPVQKAYDELYKLLKSIDSELPLAILSVSPSDETLRYSSTFIPHPFDLDRAASAPESLKYLPSAEVILQFESSPKWPDDLAAIQKVKLALMEKLARVITAHLQGAAVQITFDSTFSEIADHAGLQVLLPSGVAFLLRIHHEKERVQLERILSDFTPFGTSLPKPHRRLAQPALEAYNRRFVHRPQHHAALAPLHHRYPSYSSATRLLKRWFAAHMLSPLVPSEAIELVMTHIYLDPASMQVPASASVGFLRAVEMLASWSWRERPLFVPVSTATRDAASQSGRLRFPPDLRREADALFEQLRARDQDVVHGAWVIVTENDLAGMTWTIDTPGRVIAGRISTLARATVEAHQAMIAAGSLNVKSLFKTPLHQYDILIHLRPALLSRYSQAVEPDSSVWGQSRFRNLEVESEVRVDFDPVWSYVQDIQRLYGDALLVFYNQLGGTVIGLLWKPSKQISRALKPFLGYSSVPVATGTALVEINKDAILAEISRLGTGLIDRMEKGGI